MTDYAKPTMFELESARRIARATRQVEQNLLNNISLKGDLSEELVFAKITVNNGGGDYDGSEVEYTAGAWAVNAGGLSWGSDSSDVGDLIEMSSVVDVAVGAIVSVVLAYDEGGVPQWVFANSGGGATTMQDTISGMIEAPEEKEYILDLSVYTSGTIDQIATLADYGASDAVVKINGVEVDFGSSGVSFGGEATYTAVADNEFDEDDTLTLTITDIDSGGITDASFSLRFTRPV